VAMHVTFRAIISAPSACSHQYLRNRDVSSLAFALWAPRRGKQSIRHSAPIKFELISKIMRKKSSTLQPLKSIMLKKQILERGDGLISKWDIIRNSSSQRIVRTRSRITPQLHRNYGERIPRGCAYQEAKMVSHLSCHLPNYFFLSKASGM